MKGKRLTGLRLFLIIQVFTFLLVIITGFFALEMGSVDMNRSLKGNYFHSFIDSLRTSLHLAEEHHPLKARRVLTVGQVRNALNKMRWAVIVGGLIACISGIILARTIEYPLKKLTAGVQSVAQGDFTKSIEVTTQDEFNQLVHAYNEMVASLRKSEEHLRKVFLAADDAILTTDVDGMVTLWSQSSEKMFGYPREVIVGKSVEILFASDTDPSLLAYMRKGGDSEDRWEGEVSFRQKDGSSFDGWCVTTKLLDEDGRVIGHLSVVRDVTEKKQMQLQLIQADKMASLGELAAGVAHEINNPLSGILSNAEFLQEEIPADDQERQEEIQEIVRNSQRIKTIVRDLLNFSRQKGSEEVSVFDVKEVIESALNLTGHHIELDHIKIVKETDGSLPPLRASYNQIEQVLINLLTNARHALNEKYPGRDENKIMTIRSEQALIQGKTFVRIKLTDRGIGIPEKDLDKVCLPFFTTKPHGKGTGLGLSISYNIIQQHGGKMRFESKEGEYTTAIIELPVSEEEPENA
ncbi:MAG: PAS domain S-box protein [Deltaproteobacteria bacterium]|nr:PAS domain S-box protein [Deltaproteobacteria bacterium]